MGKAGAEKELEVVLEGREGEKKKGKQPGKRMWTPRGTEHSGFARFNVDSVKESNY